jgi:hypothetical protein
VKWNILHPNDLAQPDEEVHHADLNHENNDDDNLIKLTKQQHKLVHWKPKAELPTGFVERIGIMYEEGLYARDIVEQLKSESIGKGMIKKAIKKYRRKRARALARAANTSGVLNDPTTTNIGRMDER